MEYVVDVGRSNSDPKVGEFFIVKGNEVVFMRLEKTNKDEDCVAGAFSTGKDSFPCVNMNGGHVTFAHGNCGHYVIVKPKHPVEFVLA